MRVSQQLLTKTTLANLNENLARLLSMQEKLSTGKDLNRPSDGQVRFSQALTLQGTVEGNEQFLRNAEFAKSWMGSTEAAVNEAGSVMHRVRELAIRGSSDTNSVSERNAIAAEIDQLNSHMRAIANSDLAGRYLFAGTDTTTTPYPDPPGIDTNRTGVMKLEIGAAVTLEYNTLGVDVFGRTVAGAGGVPPVDPTNVFALMTNLSTALRANNQVAIAAVIPDLDKRQDNMLTGRALIGGKIARLDLVMDRLRDQNIELKKFKSAIQDADMAQLITDMNRHDMVYRSSLAAGARAIQPTLIDYLR